MQRQDISLDGVWMVRPDDLTCESDAGYRKVSEEQDGWIEARVPGEIHLDLVRAGQMEEPLVSDNVFRSRWPEEKSWWYRTSFSVPDGFLQHERQQLVFEGLDLYAQVFLNGRFVGSAANAFISAIFDVKPFLQEGGNELVVRMTAGTELALAKDNDPKWVEALNATEQRRDSGFLPRRWLRKPQFAYGWDWIPPLPNIGVYRSVRLEGRSLVVLHELRLDTVLDGDKVHLKTEVVVENLHPWSERRCTLELCIDPASSGSGPILRKYDLDAPIGRSPVRDTIKVPDAQLWWPNGMGAQPLYHVTARLLAGEVECDRREFNIGLRTVEIDRSRLPDGSRFCIKVNGEEVFCKGGNWGPPDAILARVSKDKYETLVTEAKNAHFNMFRVNGAGTFPDEAFFDACDRAGILVWEDFPFACCATYPDHDPEFRAVVREEAESLISSFRHHPSIALWCGSNECLGAMCYGWHGDKSKPPQTGGTIIYNQILPDVCRRLDPCRPYWPSSYCGGEDPNDELSGNCHWWRHAFMNEDISRRYQLEVYDECRARFVAEFGCIGPCHLDSMMDCLGPEERRPDHPTWALHTNRFEKGTVPEAIRYHYADPESLTVEEYILYGQMFQARALGRAVEALRFRKNDPQYDCQGALVWSYSEPWGETGWSIIDYYCRRKASYYWYRRACRPVKVIVRQRNGHLVTRVVNDTLDARTGNVEYGWFRLDGTDREVQCVDVEIPRNGMVEVARERIPDAEELDPREWIYGAVLRGDTFEQDACNWPLLPHRKLALPEPQIRVSQEGDGWEVLSPVYCHGVHVADHDQPPLSDNYFDLLPGVPRTVRLTQGATVSQTDLRAVIHA